MKNQIINTDELFFLQLPMSDSAFLGMRLVERKGMNEVYHLRGPQHRILTDMGIKYQIYRESQLIALSINFSLVGFVTLLINHSYDDTLINSEYERNLKKR